MTRQLTDKMVKNLIDAYKSNKFDLYELDTALEEYGILDTGVSDIHETFEMGYNNALQYVFSVLGIKDHEAFE